MERYLTILSFAAVVFLWSAAAAAQVCRDLDGDGAEQGFSCPASTDCEDLSWQRRPGATESCDGLDNDCDTDLDLGCDRYCDDPTLYPLFVVVETESLPQARGGCVGLFEDGMLAVSSRVIGGTDTLYYGRGYDRAGLAIGPSSPVGDPSVPTPFEVGCEMTVAGDRAIVTYHDEHDRDDGLARLMARVVDRLGRPLTPTPLDLSATSPFGAKQTPWHYEHAVWDGERFYVFWTVGGEREHLLMNRIEADGTLADPVAVIVTDDVNGFGDTIQNLRAVWTGDHIVVVVWLDRALELDDLYALKIDRSGNVLQRHPLPTKGSEFDLEPGVDRIAFVNKQRRSITEGRTVVEMLFVDLDGRFLDDPGLFELHSAPDDLGGGNVYAEWTGEMFGTAYATDFGSAGNSHHWLLSRVLPDGTVLDPGGTLLSDAVNLGNVWGLQWTGTHFWLFGIRASQVFVRQDVLCDCGDADGDNFDACMAGECDDGDPLANAFQLEVCRGLADEDCDGLADCLDVSDCPGGPGPGDVTDLVWSGSGLSWSAPPGAERFDLARGRLSDLVRRGDLRQGDCAGLELDATSWTDDGREPPAGGVLWYAVRPEGQPCHLGSYGVGGITRETEVCR